MNTINGSTMGKGLSGRIFGFVLVASIMMFVLLGMQTQPAHAFDGCPTGDEDVTAGIAQDAVQMMIEELNARRADAGVPPMKLSADLTDSALYHALDMQADNYFKRGTQDRDASGDLSFQCGVYKRIANFYGDGEVANLDHAAEMMTSGDFDSNVESVDDVLNIMAGIGEYPKLLEDIAWEFGMGYAESPTTGFQTWVLTVARDDDSYPMIIDNEAATTVDENGHVGIYMYGDWERIRFQNNGGDWSAWYQFSNEMPWAIYKAGGEQTITVEVADADGETYSTSDKITYDAAVNGGIAIGASFELDLPDGLIIVEGGDAIPLQVGLSSLNSITTGGATVNVLIALIMTVATVGIVSRRAENL